MVHVYLYWALMAGCCGYALAAGGGPERWVAAIFVVGDALSIAAMSPLAVRYARLETATFAIDLVMALLLLYLALRSRRYWTLWICAFQIVQAASHIAGVMRPEVLRLAYGILISLWAYPMMLVLAVATLRHRIRLARYGEDPAWTAGNENVAG